MLLNVTAALGENAVIPGANVSPVKRNDWFERIVALIMPVPVPVLGVLSRMIVPSLIVGLLAGPEIAVAPCIVIPLVIFSRAVQLNVPAGTMIVSPLTA